MTRYINQYLEKLHNANTTASYSSLMIILVIGFLLRFYWLYAGHAYHYLAINDEISAYQFAMRFLAGDTTTYYLGQPDFAGGKAPGPYFTLFWVAAYQLGAKTVEGALFVVMLCNTAVIVLIYRLAQQILDNRLALLTALLFATAPWTVYYAIGLWNPMMLVILGALLFLALWHVVNTDKSRSVFWVCIVLAIIPHFHMIGLFYAPAVLLVLYSMPTKLNQRWFIVGIFSAIILYLPYLIGDGMHHWQNTQEIIAGDGKDKFSLSVLKILTAPSVVLSNLPSRWAGPEFSDYMDYGNRYFGSYIVLLIINLISVLFCFYVIYALLADFLCLLRKHRFSLRLSFHDRPDIVFTALLIFVPLVMFLPTGHNYATRYTIIIFPLLFITFAARWRQLHHSRYSRTVNGALIFYILFNTYLCTSFFKYTENMLQAEKQFMPSFKKLDEIHHRLAVSIDGIPNISLSKTALSLSELEKTLLVALPTYLDIQYQYIEPHKGEKNIPLVLSPATEKVLENDIVYRGNGIIIYRPSHS